MKLKFALVVLGALAVNSAAHAGGDPITIPAPIPVPAPIPMQEGFTWYFRADLGYAMPANNPNLSEGGYQFGLGPSTVHAPVPFGFGQTGFSGVTTETSDVLIGTLGVGAYITRHLRGDITIDFRDTLNYNASTAYQYVTVPPAPAATVNGTLRETFRMHSTTVMANGYFDILPRGLFTPYVGAGIGIVYNDISRLRANSETTLAPPAPPVLSPYVTPSGGGSNVGLAAALMGGVSFAFDQRWVLDIGYRAQYLSDASANVTVINPASATQISKAIVGDHWEHQMRVGLRFNIW